MSVDLNFIVADAWVMTRRYPSLWVLGLIGGGGVVAVAILVWVALAVDAGRAEQVEAAARQEAALVELKQRYPEVAAVVARNRPPPSEVEPFDLRGKVSAGGEWLEQHAGPLVRLLIGTRVGLLIGALAVLAGRVALSRATIDIARGQDTSLLDAWRSGRPLVRRALAIDAFHAGVGLAPLWIVLGAGLVLHPSPEVINGIAGPLIVVSAVVYGACGMVATYAHRAVAIDGLGAAAAIGYGWRLLQANLDVSVRAWLLQAVLGIGALCIGLIGALLLSFVLAIPFLIVAALVKATVGDTAVWGLFWLSGLLGVAALMAVCGAAGAFSSSYWTLLYLRFKGEPVWVSDY